jgi:hypothetical protein
MTAKPSDEGSGSAANVRNVVVYSVAILAMPIIGEQIGELLKMGVERPQLADRARIERAELARNERPLPTRIEPFGAVAL